MTYPEAIVASVGLICVTAAVIYAIKKLTEIN